MTTFFLYKSFLCLTALVLIGHDFHIYNMYLDCIFVEFSRKTIYCVVEKRLEKHSGGYFSDYPLLASSTDGRNEAYAKKLWELNEHITGTKFSL